MSSTIITSVVTGGSNNHATVSEEANAIYTDFVSQGIVGSVGNTSGVAPATGGFAVNQDASPDMGVTVTAGVACVTGTPTSQDSQVLRARMSANYTTYTINANASGSTKYDWIYLQLSATNAATPSAAADNVVTLFTSRSSSNVSDNGSPPTYGLLLAVVTVANAASSITNANISDRRVTCTFTNGGQTSTDGWNVLNYAMSYGANNGNKEFTVTTPNDLTSVLSPGMKFKATRAVTPPTQSFAFASASSQYGTKASPSGISFTASFACEAWVYLNSYTGSTQTIVNRYDTSAGGWSFEINSTGQVRVVYGTTTNFTDFVSSQSLPLNRWMHVAGVVTSVSSKTGVIYINGLAVTSASGVTASTTLTQQSVDLRVGARAGTATSYFNGYMSEVRVWSASRTAANIQDNMATSLVGNESNLASLYSGNGVFTDATSNANTLTATGGAIATQAANPYNAIEYATVIAVSYSNPTTTVTLDCGTQNTIPNQTLNTPYYSSAANPLNLPVNLKKYRRSVLLCNTFATAATTATQVTGATITLTNPTGSSGIRGLLSANSVFNSSNTTNVVAAIWDGAVSSGTQIAQAVGAMAAANQQMPLSMAFFATPVSGSKTYNIDFHASGGGTASIAGGVIDPILFILEVDL